MSKKPVLAIAGLALLAAAAVATWWFTPLRHGVTADDLARWLAPLRDSAFAVPITLAAYVVAGLLFVPMSIVMVATGLSFGPGLGAALALGGCLLSATVSFALGRALGRDVVHRLPSPRVQRLNRILGDHGFGAIATLRVVPVAPFGLVNLVAGASDMSFRDYFLGTVVMLTPSVILTAFFGDRLGAILRDPGVGTALAALVTLTALVVTGLWLRSRVRARAARSAIVRSEEPY